jgi:hypothetical protein
MPLRELAKKAGYWLGGHFFEGLLDALCEWLVRALAALVAALLSGLLGVACRHGTATPLRHLLPRRGERNRAGRSPPTTWPAGPGIGGVLDPLAARLGPMTANLGLGTAAPATPLASTGAGVWLLPLATTSPASKRRVASVAQRLLLTYTALEFTPPPCARSLP